MHLFRMAGTFCANLYAEAVDYRWVSMMLDITLSGRNLQGCYGYLAANPAVQPHGALTGMLPAAKFYIGR